MHSTYLEYLDGALNVLSSTPWQNTSGSTTTKDFSSGGNHSKASSRSEHSVITSHNCFGNDFMFGPLCFLLLLFFAVAVVVAVVVRITSRRLSPPRVILLFSDVDNSNNPVSFLRKSLVESASSLLLPSLSKWLLPANCVVRIPSSLQSKENALWRMMK